jgi:hypothetical protein
MSNLHAYFRCGNCRESIKLPYSTLKDYERSQPRLPKEDWNIYFVCCVCNNLTIVTARDLRLDTPAIGETPELRRKTLPDAFYRVEYLCSCETCSVPVVVFVHFRTYITESTAAQTVTSLRPRPTCAERHSLNNKSSLVSVREVFTLF